MPDNLEDLHDPGECPVTAIEDKLSQVLRDNDKMLIRFVLMAECMDSDGERGAWVVTPPELKHWELLGMIEYLRASAYSEVADELNG